LCAGSRFYLPLTARQYGGPSVKYRSRLLGIGIVRSQPCEIARSFHLSHISQGQNAAVAVTQSCPDRIEDPDRSVRSVGGKHRAVPSTRGWYFSL